MTCGYREREEQSAPKWMGLLSGVDRSKMQNELEIADTDVIHAN